jgi:hypothetical protein
MHKLYSFKCLFVLICLVAAHTGARAQFVLYQRMFFTGIPGNLGPYLTPYILDYNAAVGGSNGGGCTPNVANIQQYAATGLGSPAEPVSFDVELSGWPSYTTTAFTDSLNNYIRIVNDFKAGNSISKVGFYAVPPQQIYNSFSNVGSGFAPTALAMLPLANAVDYYSPDFYNYGSTDTALWRKATDTTLAVIKKYYPAKPVYPYISPGLSTGIIDSVTWLYNLNYLYTHTQGALLWSGYTPNWDPNAPWWRCTKMFLVNKGLAPPLVLDKFSVSGISAGGVTVAWTTSSDTVSQYFVLQRGADSIHFTAVSGQIARAGYAYNLNQYQLTDTTTVSVDGQTLYYRLAITDGRNQVTYSPLLYYTRNSYRSQGGGVSADLRTSTNWQVLAGGGWVSASSAPESNLVTGDTVIVRPGDTLQDPTQYTSIPAGATLLDSGQVGTMSWGFSNYGTFVFTGATAVSVPGTAIAEGGTWGNVVVNDAAGVRITQGSGDNLIHIDSLALQAGTLTVNADSGHSAAVYLDGPLAASGGHLAVTASGFNQGVFLDGSGVQAAPGGLFLNNTVPALTLSNANGVSCGGPLIVTRSTHLTRPASFSVAGNLTLDSLTIDTLGGYVPVAATGMAILNGVLTVKDFPTTPASGQQYTVLTADSISGAFSAGPVLPGGLAGSVATVGHNVILTVGTPYAFTDSLLPVADAFVKSGSTNENTNFGSASYLGVESGYYQAYMKFDLSSLTTPVSNAQLRLYNLNAVATTWQLYKVDAAGNSWSENTITWNNQPAADTLLASFTSPSGAGYVYWDITAKLDSLLTTAGGTVSFKIVSTSTSYDAFASKENSTAVERPYLMLNKTAPGSDSLPAVADAFVKSSTPTTNYGYNSYLAADNVFYNSYLKFDLHGLSGRVVDAQLRLYSLAGASTQWQLYKAGNDSWTESGITWNNQPGGDTLLATITAPAAAGFVYWDIAQELAHAGADSTLSLEVIATAATYSAFSSRQGVAAEAPEILYAVDTSGLGTESFNPAIRMASAALAVLADTTYLLPDVIGIYPNPASGSCYVVSPGLINTITLVDNTGRIVRTVMGLSTNRYLLSLSGVAAGVYYIRVNGAPIGAAGKLIKFN